MGIYDLITARKTVYSFADKPVKEETVIHILDAARLAPAAGGIHEYEFLVVSEQGLKDKLSQLCMTPNINSAPFIIIVFCDPDKLKTMFGEDGNVFCIENAALAIENILLSAEEYELGSAWIATIDQDGIRKLFGIPEKYVVRGIIPVGYPSPEGKGAYPVMKPSLKEITHVERFNNRAE